MKLKNISLNSRSGGDIHLSANGMMSIAANFINQHQLWGNKRVLFSLDEDDKQKKYLYLTIDQTGLEPGSKLIVKSKAGSVQMSVRRIAEAFSLKGKKADFKYTKKITDGARPYFQFERMVE